jgi:hypothetical protein
MGHFGVKKTEDILTTHFFCPMMRRDMVRFVACCTTCQKAKSRLMWTSTPTHNQISGLITQSRACQLNNQVSSFLASYSSYLDNGNMCSILFLRNDG